MIEEILAAIKKGNWDPYREHFPTMTLEDRINLCTTWDKWFPKQAHFSPELVKKMLSSISDAIGEMSVVELGCHAGDLAKRMLKEVCDIVRWVGYDINWSAIQRTAINDARYCPIWLMKWFHETRLPEFEVFVCTHTFEHMLIDEVDKIIGHVAETANWLILEIPIEEGGQDWSGYNGAHVLREGRADIRNLILRHGFVLFDEAYGNGWVTGWKRGEA